MSNLQGESDPKVFATVLAKMNFRLARWQGKILSAGAKLVLIKSALIALPVYLLAILDPPIMTISKI